MIKKSDNLYSEVETQSGSFKFDSRVAEVFDDMIQRSVPGYSQIISLLPTLARQFQQKNKNYYDLGCSTGAGIYSLAQGLDSIPAKLIAIDSSQAMVAQARKIERALAKTGKDIQLVCADISKHKIENAAMVLLNFTLQFIPLDDRDQLITAIYQGLEPEGVLVLSEKIKSDTHCTEELLTRVHHQYKADQGYSQLEISNKRDAIENVLIAETLPAHVKRLRAAGFRTITPWIRNLQFVSLLAVK